MKKRLSVLAVLLILSIFISGASSSMEFPKFTHSLLAETASRMNDVQTLNHLGSVLNRNAESGQIKFVESSNRPPNAVIRVNAKSGMAPFEVEFDGSRSRDRDGDSLTFEWDFESDGTPDANEPSVVHTYMSAGTYRAALTVTDGQGGEKTSFVQIKVGNAAPEPIIESPADETTYSIGDVFELRGSAADTEDGSLSNHKLSWSVYHHYRDKMWVLLEPTTGNEITLQPIPDLGEIPMNRGFIEIRLTATDSFGLATTMNRMLRPKGAKASDEKNSMSSPDNRAVHEEAPAHNIYLPVVGK